MSALVFQIARSHLVVRLADEPTCKLALHYHELGEDMREVIATKDAAHTREKCGW